jgi:outer membrane receptor for ferric coprogen and ferric-rhodotorulic acid
MARCHSLIRPAARAALLALACAATGAPAQPAEGAPQPAQAAQEYHIAPGALDDALARFATQAGISLDMPQPLVRGRSSPGLQGRFGVREGLARLLAGTGLEAVARGPGVYQLRAVPEVHTAAPATLDAVRVTAQAERGDTTEGTGSYTTRSMGTKRRSR